MHPLTERILGGDVRATARACRLCDDRVPGYLDLLRELFPRTGRAFLVGVTGNPGAGKSTVVDRMIEQLRKGGKRVAVVAVDPTSPYSGGAILGDRIRMQRHFEDPGVFIRSVATRGALGGLSRSAWDVVNVLDAWGADVVLIETVGVGQDELEITRTAHSTVVVVAPGLGDDVQANKAGLMECADVFAVNKADRDGADGTVRDLELMLALGGEIVAAGAHSRGHAAGHLDLARQEVKHGEGAWVPPIVRCVATKNQGIEELLTHLDEHRAWLAGPRGQRRLAQRQQEQLRGFLRETLVDEATSALGQRIEEAANRVFRREVDPYTASEELVAAFRRG
jgi:LAO/AO transport system kinase